MEFSANVGGDGSTFRNGHVAILFSRAIDRAYPENGVSGIIFDVIYAKDKDGNERASRDLGGIVEIWFRLS